MLVYRRVEGHIEPVNHYLEKEKSSSKPPCLVSMFVLCFRLIRTKSCDTILNITLGCHNKRIVLEKEQQQPGSPREKETLQCESSGFFVHDLPANSLGKMISPSVGVFPCGHK